MLWPGPRLGREIVRFAPLLTLAYVFWSGQPALALATSLPSEFTLATVAPPLTSVPPPTPAPIPRPASRYMLDVDAVGAALPNVGSFTSSGPQTSADGAVSTCRFQAASDEAGTTTVESIIRVLSTDDQAKSQYDNTQGEKSRQYRESFVGWSGWTDVRVSGLQATIPPDERATVAVLRYRNAVALVEIRGSAQHVSVENAKELMKKINDSLRDAVGDAG